MRTADAIAHFKTKTALAQALGISVVAVVRWGDLVPTRRAYELERLTSGALRAEWPNKPPAPAQLPGPAGA